MPLHETSLSSQSGWNVEWLLDDGTSVARLSIVNRDMRFGQSIIRMGGIAGVGTNRESRNKGYASQIMHGANALMKREGYDAAFLFGIPDFYHRFGYTTCMPEHDLKIDTRDAERAKSDLVLRQMTKQDLPVVARVYNRDTHKLTASIYRNPKSWAGFPHGSFFGRKVDAHVVLSKQNRIVGYVAYDADEDRCRASEVGGQGESVYAAILSFLASRAVKLRREGVTLSMPANHPFAYWARDFGFVETTQYQRNRGPMGRLINLPSFFEKIAPELSRRLSKTVSPCVFTLVTDLGDVTLSCRDQAVTVVSKKSKSRVQIAQDDLMVLAMGYKSVADLVTVNRLRASAPVRDILSHLFPLQTAHMWWADRF